MEQIFAATVKQLLTLFFFIFIGFVLRRGRLLPDGAAIVLSKLETWVFVPALTLNTFMTKCTPQALADRRTAIIYSIILSVAALIVARLISPLFVRRKKACDDSGERKRIENIYVYALAFSNLGFMGNALVLAVFGEEALFDYMIFTLAYNVLIYGYGTTLLIPNAEGSGVRTFFRRLANPIFISIALGIVIGLLGIRTPEFLNSAVSAAGSCMAPIAMLLTGYVIGCYDIVTMLSNFRVYIVSALRLVLLPLLFVLPLKWLGSPDEVVLSAACVTAMPLGINTVIFPAAYGGDPSLGAAMALISHTLAVFTIPVMFALLL